MLSDGLVALPLSTKQAAPVCHALLPRLFCFMKSGKDTSVNVSTTGLTQLESHATVEHGNSLLNLVLAQLGESDTDCLLEKF